MGGTGRYQYTAEVSNRWRKYPANFLYSGYFLSSSASSRGSLGTYWSSTAYNADQSDDQSYSLELYSTSVNPGAAFINKSSGNSARCVAGQ